jgi:hypothetical protein
MYRNKRTSYCVLYKIKHVYNYSYPSSKYFDLKPRRFGSSFYVHFQVTGGRTKRYSSVAPGWAQLKLLFCMLNKHVFTLLSGFLRPPISLLGLSNHRQRTLATTDVLRFCIVAQSRIAINVQVYCQARHLPYWADNDKLIVKWYKRQNTPTMYTVYRNLLFYLQ